MKVYRQGVSTYVIGTDDANTACRAAGIGPNTHHWKYTDFGMFVRRQGMWRFANAEKPPKDAKPGVLFCGPIEQVRGDRSC